MNAENARLLAVIEAGDAAETRLALGAGADVEAVNDAGTTPLACACLYGRLTIVRLLIEHGADLARRTRVGLSAFEQAVSWGHPAVVEALLDAGLDVDWTDDLPRGPAGRGLGSNPRSSSPAEVAPMNHSRMSKSTARPSLRANARQAYDLALAGAIGAVFGLFFYVESIRTSSIWLRDALAGLLIGGAIGYALNAVGPLRDGAWHTLARTSTWGALAGALGGALGLMLGEVVLGSFRERAAQARCPSPGRCSGSGSGWGRGSPIGRGRSSSSA